MKNLLFGLPLAAALLLGGCGSEPAPQIRRSSTPAVPAPVVSAPAVPVPAAPVPAVSVPKAPAPAVPVSAAVPVSDELDAAIREASNYLNGNIPKGSKILILNIQSASAALSDYILDELVANAVNDRVFSVVDRQQLSLIRTELEFQHSGNVDDTFAQEIGKMAGAQTIVSGAVSQYGETYRLRIRALAVQTAQVQGQFNRNIPKGPTITALINSQSTAYSTGGSQGGAAQSPPPAASPGAGAPKQGPAASSPAAAAPVSPPSTAPAPAAPAPTEKVYKISDTGPAGGTVFYPVVRTSSALPATAQSYKIGDTGPAGGTVFYPIVRTSSAPPSASQSYQVGDAGPTGGTVFYPVIRTSSAPPTTAQSYQISDTGPAGGTVFYPVIRTSNAPPATPQTYQVSDMGPAEGTIFYPVVRTSNIPSTTPQSYQIGDTGPTGGTIFYPVVRISSAPPATSQSYQAGDAGPTGGTVFYPVIRTSSVPPTISQSYQIGDTGPAGGIIFYINPVSGEGWKYLEAAPARTEVTSKWTAEQIPTKDINGARTIGSGKPNSEYIMRVAMERGGGFGWAAQVCDALEVNGFNDWFLPSRDELNMMWGALHQKGLGGFKGEKYWSSTATTDNGYGAITQNFSDGNVDTSNWNGYNEYKYTYRVRAIRQF